MTIRIIFIVFFCYSSMKRKVVLHGPSTLTVSLPSLWAKKFGIKKGDELDVVEEGGELRIGIKDASLRETKKFILGDFKRVGQSCVTSAYRQGYGGITLQCADLDYLATLRKLIHNETIGFEVVKQERNLWEIKDLAGQGKDEFNLVLRRLWLLVMDLAQEGVRALEKEDEIFLKSMDSRDFIVNKFSNYCLRTLILRNPFSYSLNPVYYCVIRNLETIADHYKDLCLVSLSIPSKMDKNSLSFLIDSLEVLNMMHSLFYKYDEFRMEALFKKSKKLCNDVLKDTKRRLSGIYSLCKSMNDFLSLLVELNL